MQILRSTKEMQALCRKFREQGKQIGLVPTMGALHAGHLSLLRAARESCDVVAVTIFVNPTQFGPNEDFAKYPRTFEQDCALLEAEHADLVFAPTAEEMYPDGSSTFVVVEGVSDRLDGASRPGHFRGVTTVVNKLFNIACPQRAFFGQKDAAQVAVLRKMIRDLNMNVELVVCPIVREADGLALSSRNKRLTPAERAIAPVLSRALREALQLIDEGERSVARVQEEATRLLTRHPEVRVEYFSVTDPETLTPVKRIEGPVLIAGAIWLGSVRLIDNLAWQQRGARTNGVAC